MSRCGKKCHDDCHDCNKCHKKVCHDDCFQCLRHNKCKNDCKDNDCKCDIQLVKDCVCCEWSVPEGQTQTVFQTGGFEQIFGSGFISFDCGPGNDFVTVQFYLGNTPVGMPINVFQDSCVTFTFTKFDRITVTCQAVPGVMNGNADCECDNCEGEICITTRFPVC
ncbi:S-Ena type endospore appendage [Neobacillus rhizosphaerae]|uniref:S-Ena type endospore appendage n=1 Tax=Neobacillus rhizosphaerae TaxID=2880965 RepID=UPI003D2790E7